MKEESHKIYLDLNPKRNRFGWLAASDGVGWESKRKSPRHSGSSNESSNHDTLETAQSLDTSAYAPFYDKS